MQYPHFLHVLRRRLWALAFFAALVCFSTVVFSYVEKHTLFDSFYWTVTVISTVGFGDITPHTQIGELLFIFDALSGINIYIYLITRWQASLVFSREDSGESQSHKPKLIPRTTTKIASRLERGGMSRPLAASAMLQGLDRTILEMLNCDPIRSNIVPVGCGAQPGRFICSNQELSRESQDPS